MVRAYKTASIFGDVPLSRSAGRKLVKIRQRLRNLFGLMAGRLRRIAQIEARRTIACVTPEQAERDAEWEQEKAETLAAW